MTKTEPETTGYCRTCGGYGRGRFVEVISEYADAIDQHTDCPASGQPDPPPISWQDEVCGVHRPAADVPGPLDQPRPSAHQ